MTAALLDPAARQRRLALVDRLAEMLKGNAVWGTEAERLGVARRIAFASWRFNELKGWQGALRNRSEGR